MTTTDFIQRFTGLTPLPEEWSETEQSLTKASSLGPDWDGAGADPPTQQALLTTIRLLGELKDAGFPAPTFCYAHYDGSMQLEWFFNYTAGSHTYTYCSIDITDRFGARVMTTADGILYEHHTLEGF